MCGTPSFSFSSVAARHLVRHPQIIGLYSPHPQPPSSPVISVMSLKLSLSECKIFAQSIALEEDVLSQTTSGLIIREEAYLSTNILTLVICFITAQVKEREEIERGGWVGGGGREVDRQREG